MKITKTNFGCLAFENARLLFTNFEGRADRFSDGGKRSFCIAIDDEAATEELRRDGWNIKELAPFNEGEPPTFYMTVKLTFDSRRPPHVYMHGFNNVTPIDATNAKILDESDIVSADCVVRPYEWEPGRISAWLQELHVTIAEDYFAGKYRAPAEESDEDDLPF